MVRTSLLTAIGAMLGVALATLGRNTAFALVVVFGWITIVEGMIRGLKPGLARFLWGENMTIVLAWARLDNVQFRPRSGARAPLGRALRVGVRRGRDVDLQPSRHRRRVMIKTLKTLAAIAIGISVFVTGLGITLAFGMFAFIGMPMLIVGLGVLSAAIEIDRRRLARARGVLPIP